jgi:orotate phosphoribosyltransferase
MMDTQTRVAQILLEIGAVGFSPQSPVTFKSGLLSPVYMDNRRLPYWPKEWCVVIDGFRETIARENIPFDIIAGIEVGGVPHSAALGYAMLKPSVFVRKQAKEHGTQNRVEGGSVTGKRVLLVEDLVTTGGSSLSGVEALRQQGALVEHCLAIVSYGFPQAIAAFAETAVRLHTLTSFPVILREAGRYFAGDDRAIIEDWLRDPTGWPQRHGFA